MNKVKNIPHISLKIAVISIVCLILTSCIAFLNVNGPVDLVWDKAVRKSDSLIVFLSGLYNDAETFKEEDFFI